MEIFIFSAKNSFKILSPQQQKRYGSRIGLLPNPDFISISFYLRIFSSERIVLIISPLLVSARVLWNQVGISDRSRTRGFGPQPCMAKPSSWIVNPLNIEPDKNVGPAPEQNIVTELGR